MIGSASGYKTTEVLWRSVCITRALRANTSVTSINITKNMNRLRVSISVAFQGSKNEVSSTLLHNNVPRPVLVIAMLPGRSGF